MLHKFNIFLTVSNRSISAAEECAGDARSCKWLEVGYLSCENKYGGEKKKIDKAWQIQ